MEGLFGNRDAGIEMAVLCRTKQEVGPSLCWLFETIESEPSQELVPTSFNRALCPTLVLSLTVLASNTILTLTCTSGEFCVPPR